MAIDPNRAPKRPLFGWLLGYEGLGIGGNLGRSEVPGEIKALESEEKVVVLKRYMDGAGMIA